MNADSTFCALLSATTKRAARGVVVLAADDAAATIAETVKVATDSIPEANMPSRPTSESSLMSTAACASKVRPTHSAAVAVSIDTRLASAGLSQSVSWMRLISRRSFTVDSIAYKASRRYALARSWSGSAPRAP